MQRRLGKGLGSLLAGSSANEPSSESPLELPIDKVRPNPHQPRRVFDSDQLEELRDSLRRYGLLQPVCVRPTGAGYELIAGERRWRAARLAGWTTIPAVLREGVGDEQMLELALVENLQREDLDPIERARAFREMIERLGLTQEQIALRVGLKRATVTNHLRLLELPERVQEAVVQGLLTMGHARALAGVKEEARALRLLSRVVREGLSVRQLEDDLRAARPALRAGGSAPATAMERPPWLRDFERRLREHFGTKVGVHDGPGHRGTIALHYHSREELERLMAALVPQRPLS